MPQVEEAVDPESVPTLSRDVRSSLACFVPFGYSESFPCPIVDIIWNEMIFNYVRRLVAFLEMMKEL